MAKWTDFFGSDMLTDDICDDYLQILAEQYVQWYRKANDEKIDLWEQHHFDSLLDGMRFTLGCLEPEGILWHAVNERIMAILYPEVKGSEE